MAIQFETALEAFYGIAGGIAQLDVNSRLPLATLPQSGIWRVIDTRSTPITHTAGATTEQALATITIPGGSLGQFGIIRIHSGWTSTGSGTKTFRIRFGGASGDQYLASSVTTQLTLFDMKIIRNQSSVSSQRGQVAANPIGGFGQTTGTTFVTGSRNTAVDQDVVFSVQVGTGGDSATLEFCIVEVHYKN